MLERSCYRFQSERSALEQGIWGHSHYVPNFTHISMSHPQADSDLPSNNVPNAKSNDNTGRACLYRLWWLKLQKYQVLVTRCNTPQLKVYSHVFLSHPRLTYAKHEHPKI